MVENIYDPQTLNRYSYVRNNPLRYTDPTGHNFLSNIFDVYNIYKSITSIFKKPEPQQKNNTGVVNINKQTNTSSSTPNNKSVASISTTNPSASSQNSKISANNTSKQNSGIVGGCASGSIGLGIYGTCSSCMLYSIKEKSIGISGSFGWGGTTGLNLGISAQGIYSNSKNFSEFSGQDVSAGASYGEAITVGGDVSWGIDDANIKTYSGGPGLGAKLSLPFFPFEAHGGTNYTNTISILNL